MGRRGPQPKPTMLKVLEGNPGKQKLNRHEPVPIKPLDAPDIVKATPAADEEWRRVVASYPPDFYTDADRPVLTVYCMSWAIYRNALSVLAREGMVSEGSTGQKVAHPAIGIIAKQTDKILRAADHLAMSPAARARVSAPDPIGGALYSEEDPDDALLKG